MLRILIACSTVGWFQNTIVTKLCIFSRSYIMRTCPKSTPSWSYEVIQD